MARTNVAAQSFIGSYPALPLASGGADMVFAAGDVANGNSTALTNNKTMLFVQNTDTGAHTVTIASVADSLNRTGDITTYSVAAGKVAAFGPFASTGWANSGVLNFNVSDATLHVAVVTLP